MQGLYITGSRPKSKKEVKETLDRLYEENPENPDLFAIVIEATSIFGNEYDGSLHSAPIHNTFYFVGPDPHTHRKFYGQLSFDQKKNRWTVK